MQRGASDFQLTPLESEKLMLEALQFAQFQREHPLENWTVGSLPQLRHVCRETQPRSCELAGQVFVNRSIISR